jgi:hypothetical protein
MKRIGLLMVALSAGSASADVLWDNFAPGNGYLGNTGWSVAWGGPFGAHIEESVSFTPTIDCRLDRAEIAIGHLYGPNEFTMRLHADGGQGPGNILEAVVVQGQLLPFPNEPTINNPPVVITFTGNAQLAAGTKYWLSVTSVVGQDAWLAWNYNTTEDRGERAWRQDGGPWNVFNGMDPRGTFRVIGTPAGACYANCDSSTVAPVLNVADFTCFLQRYAAGDSYANCDQSTGPPVLNVADFTCFLQQFAAGCP